MLSESPVTAGFGLLRMACLPIIRPAFQARNASLIANLAKGIDWFPAEAIRPAVCSGLRSVNRMGMDAENRKRFQQPLGRCALQLCAWSACFGSLFRSGLFLLLLTLSWLNSALSAGEVAIDFPVGDPELPIQITAQRGTHWQQGSYEVWYLDHCQVRQGGVAASGSRAIIWLDRSDPFHKRLD